MAFQNKVNTEMGLGVPGDLVLESPTRAERLFVNSDGKENVVGHAYTKDPVTNIAKVGGEVAQGTLVFAGILVNTKQSALYGTQAGTLSPSLVIPDNSTGDFLTMGDVVVHVTTACKVGDYLVYDKDTGELSTVADSTALGGKQLVPNARIHAYPVTGAGGLTVARLTN